MCKKAHFCLCNLLTINEKKVKRLKTDNTDNFIYFWGFGGPEAARCRAVTPSLRTMSNIGSDLVGVLGPLLVLLLIVISFTRRKKKPRQRDDEVERPHHWWPVQEGLDCILGPLRHPSVYNSEASAPLQCFAENSFGGNRHKKRD